MHNHFLLTKMNTLYSCINTHSPINLKILTVTNLFKLQQHNLINLKFSDSTCCTQRMSNGHCTSINIDLFRIKSQLISAIYKLGSKCLYITILVLLFTTPTNKKATDKYKVKLQLFFKYLIYLEEINIIQLKTRSLDSNRYCSSGANTHDGRIHTYSSKSPA